MKIRRNHTLGLAEARIRVDSIAESLSGKYGLNTAWDGDSLKIDGSGVNGQIIVGDQAVDVDVKLSFALKMLEGTIRTSIEDAMDKYLGLP